MTAWNASNSSICGEWPDRSKTTGRAPTSVVRDQHGRVVGAEDLHVEVVAVDGHEHG
jgi:hypothetical protein